MGVYFGRLFDLMIKRNINQETLCQACNISTKTLAAMRRGMMPSMEVIDKICNYLDCDFADIMQHVKNDIADPLVGKQIDNNRMQGCSVYKVALKEYMKMTGVTVERVCTDTGLCINTVKGLLFDKIISLKSCIKLMQLSDDFVEILNEKAKLYQQGQPLEDSAVIMARNKIVKYAGDSDTVALLKVAASNFIEKKNLGKKACCEKIGISIQTFEKLMGGKAVSCSIIHKILDQLSEREIIEIAEKIDESKPCCKLNTKFRPRNCNKCPAFNNEFSECHLLYSIEKAETGEYYSSEPCSKPRTYTAVYEEGQKRNIQFKKPKNVEYFSTKNR